MYLRGVPSDKTGVVLCRDSGSLASRGRALREEVQRMVSRGRCIYIARSDNMAGGGGGYRAVLSLPACHEGAVRIVAVNRGYAVLASVDPHKITGVQEMGGRGRISQR